MYSQWQYNGRLSSNPMSVRHVHAQATATKNGSDRAGIVALRDSCGVGGFSAVWD
jgi:hypothetical protein